MRKDSSGRRAIVRQRAGSLVPSRRLAGLAGVAVALLFLALPTLARADMEESDKSAVLVEQAIALIANDAGQARVAERIDDALKAPRKEGVDLGLVGRALAVVERPGQDEAALGEARALLLKSLGGKLPSAPQPGQFATGTETGTSADRHAVVQGITTPYNSGVNEGRITDVKLQKRLMAGRAGVSLLRHRVDLIAHLHRRYSDRPTMAPK
ncbi:hypothetical protein [Streptomyces sp. NPDC054797]